MRTATDHAMSDFAAAGVKCAEAGVLPDALDELAVRLDLAGAGPVLEEWIARRPKRAARRRRQGRILRHRWEGR